MMRHRFFLKKQIKIIFIFFAILFLASYLFPSSYAHLEHRSSGGVIAGGYFSYMGLVPNNPTPEENTRIVFSVQDENGNDTYNIETMVEIYSGGSGKRIFYEPWTERSIGDFEIPFVFEESGTYQIVLSISEENDVKEHVIPPHMIISSSSGM